LGCIGPKNQFVPFQKRGKARIFCQNRVSQSGLQNLFIDFNAIDAMIDYPLCDAIKLNVGLD